MVSHNYFEEQIEMLKKVLLWLKYLGTVKQNVFSS